MTYGHTDPHAAVGGAPPQRVIDAIVDIRKIDDAYVATTVSGFSFLIGAATPYRDDMRRLGLGQGPKTIASTTKAFGVYKAADFAVAFGKWAFFVEPILSAEGGARFATLNTYDRAAFTFGAPQLAAHTPNDNLILLLRRLLALPDADLHFPELSLRPGAAGKTTVHLSRGSGFQDLEEEIDVRRPDGTRATQLVRLMTYLNPSPTEIDEAELSASARLMNWLRLDPEAKRLQIEVFIQIATRKLAETKKKVIGFDGRDWRIALLVMDIRHQGRGGFADISNALASGDPLAALRMVGFEKYASRIKTVDERIAALETSGLMDGFQV